MNEGLLTEHVNNEESHSPSTPKDDQAFMSFSTKHTSVQPSDKIQRRYTQKKPPPNINDFINEFEQGKSVDSTPVIKRSNSIQILPNNKDDMISFDNNLEIQQQEEEEEEGEEQDFSDTARLTVNASTQSGFYQNRPRYQQDEEEEIYKPRQQPKRKSKLYEPALIDPEIDQRTRKLNKLIHFDKDQITQQFSRTIRKLSKRVINLHDNNNVSSSQPQQQLEKVDQDGVAQSHNKTIQNDIESDTYSSLVINEAIPMKQTYSNKDTTYPYTTTASSSRIPPSIIATMHSNEDNHTPFYINPEKKDIKEYVHLHGYSLKILSPTNPLRKLLTKLLCFK